MTLTMTTPDRREHVARRPRRTTGPAGGLSQMTLEVLVRQAAEGDEVAWREIERRYHQLAQGVARRMGVRPADVPDVLQHVWLQLFRTLPSLREPAYLAAWIRTTTKRESVRVLRRQDHQVLAGDIELTGAPTHDHRDAMDEAIVRHDVAAEVALSARGLPSRCRQLLGVLLIDPSSSYQEIADRLDWPMGSVGPTKARCFVSLRQMGHLRPLEA
jgi:RNA polymerase sigma factor (sigma-70 family)